MVQFLLWFTLEICCINANAVIASRLNPPLPFLGLSDYNCIFNIALRRPAVEIDVDCPFKNEQINNIWDCARRKQAGLLSRRNSGRKSDYKTVCSNGDRSRQIITYKKRLFVDIWVRTLYRLSDVIVNVHIFRMLFVTRP